MSRFKTAKQRYTVDFPPVYGTLKENQLLRAQINQEGDTDIPVPFTVTIYLSLAKNTMSLLTFDLVFEDVRVSSSSKHPEQHIHPLSKSNRALQLVHK